MRGMKRSALISVLFVFLGVLLVAQTGKPVELAQEPHYKQLLANDAVRVWRLELEPREQTAMHRHGLDYLMIQLQDGETSTTNLTSPPSAPIPKQWNEGEMWYIPAKTHAVRNDTARPLRQIEVELLKLGPSGDYVRDRYNDVLQPRYFPPPRYPFGNYSESGTFYNVYLTQQGLLPGASTDVHEHKVPHLVVALTDLELKNEVEGKAARTVSLRKGEVAWVESTAKHKLTNVGNRLAQLVTVEYR